MSATPMQSVVNILEEAKRFLQLRPDLFQQVNRFVISRLYDASRVMNDEQLFLLQFSLRNFEAPFEAYYDRLFVKRLRESGLKKKILEKGLNEGEAIFVTTVINDLDIKKVVEVKGGIDEEGISETLSKRLKILGDEKMKIAFWEIIHAVSEVLPKISREASEELMTIYESLIELAKTNDIRKLKKEVEKYTLNFDSKIRKEFVVS